MASKKNSVSAADKIKKKQEELEEKKRQQAAKEAEKAAQKAAQKAASAASKVSSTTGKTGTGTTTTTKPSTSSSSTFTQAKKSTQKKAQVPVPELGAGTSVSETETEIRATSAPKNNTTAQKKASSFISRSEVAKTQTPKTTQKQTTNRGSFGTGSMVAREATGRRNYLDVLEQDSERTTSGSPNVLNARREEQLRYQYPANMKWLEEYTKERNAVDPFVNQNQNQPGAGLRSAYVEQRRKEELAAAKREEIEKEQAIIDEYESIPDFGALEKLGSFGARDLVERRKELEPQYKQIKADRAAKAIYGAGYTDEDILNALNYDNDKLRHILSRSNWLPNTPNFGEEYSDPRTEGLLEFARQNGINLEDMRSLSEEYRTQKNVESANAHPIRDSLLSVAANPMESFGYLIPQIRNYLNNDKLEATPSFVETARGTVGQSIESKPGQFLYDTGMSIGDQGIAMLANLAFPSSGAALLAGEKAASVLRSSLQKGYSDDQAAALAAITAATTYLSEAAGIKKLDDIAETAPNIYLALLAAGTNEGGQEMFEGILDSAADTAIGGKNSDIARRYAELKESGMEPGSIFLKMLGEYASDRFMDFLGGAVMGGALGLAGNVLSRVGNRIPSIEDTTTTPTSQETALNPATMAQQNENAFADAVRQRAETVRNIEALNEQIQEQNVQTQQPIDALQNPAYTQNVTGTEGGAVNGEINGRGSEENNPGTTTGRLGDSGEYDGGGNAVGGSGSVRERSAVTPDIRASFNEAGIADNQLSDYSDDYASFSAALDAAKASNDHGAFVDSKSVDELQEAGAKAFMSDDGAVTVCVKANGDISGVCKNPQINKDNHFGAVNDMLFTARANGGDRLDCYGSGLVSKYTQSGFEPVARVPYEPFINPEMDAWCEEQEKANPKFKRPDIFFMKVRDGETLSDSIQNLKNGTFTKYSEEYLASLPVMDYESAGAYRDGLIEQGRQSSVGNGTAFSNGTNGPAGTPPINPTNTGSGRTLAAEVEREENPHIEMNIPEYGPEPGEATPGEEWEDRDRSAQYESPDRMNSTQAARNTLWSLPTVQQNVDMQKYMLEQEANGTFSADVVHNVDSVLKATEAIDKAVERDGNVDGLLNDILGNGTSIDSLGAVQQDELMMCLDMKLAEAAKTGDFTGVEEILRKTNTREHNIGQALQALAKYTKTSSAAISKANKLIDGNTDAYFRRPGNQGKKNTNAKLARALATMGNKYADVKAEVKPPTHAELLQQVRNTLEPEFASVDELISDSTIEQITALLEGDIPMWQLRDELEHYFKNGEFYTIYEGEEEMHKKSRELATALDRVVNGDPEKAAPDPKTLQQIRDEINTLLEDSEYASIYDEFSDEDIEFLANRIFRGAGQDELVDRLNRKLATGYLGMSNEDLAEVVRLYDEVNSGLLTSEEEYDAMQAANKILASYLGKGTVLERLNQWRYLCMLSAPSTHLKNIASNATWGMVTGIKDAVAAAGEEALQRAGVDFQRTKAIINPAKEADRAILQGAYEAFNRDSYADYARGGSRYNDRSEIKQAQQVGSKAVNALANLNSNLLSKEDIFFGRMKYAQALAGYVKANGRTADVFNSTDPADMAFLKQAEEYALSEANKTTFHEENELAAKITQASRSASEGGTAGLNVAIEALMPFKRTTANIGKQFLVEYNPVVQFPKAIIQTMQKNGDVAGTIDSYAKGLTGTGLVALGLWLAKSGLMVARKDDDDKSDVLNEAQNYAITWTSEDGTSHSYTIDGLAPTAMLMCVGAELAEKGFTLEALAGMGESFLGNTLLSGFESVFNAIGRAYAARQYDPDKHIGTAVAADMVNSYASQYIPTLMGKVARTVDPIRRNTYYTGKTGDTDTLLGYAQKAAAKIPFLSKTLQPYVDAYGNEERQPGKNAVSRFLYNMFSIGYYSERERDAIQDKISELDQYSQSLDDVAREEMEKTLNSLFGSASKSYDGEKLTPEQYTQYQKVLGNNTVNLYNGMLSSERFQSLNPEGQAQLMHDLGLFANALSKHEIFDYTPGGSSKYVKLFKAYEESGIDGVVDAYCDSVEKSQEKKANSESAAEPEGSNSQTIPEYNPLAATGVNYAETPEPIPEPQQEAAPKQEPIPEPEAPKYDASKVFSSYGYVAPGGAAELKNAGYSDKERGQILFNDQKEPGKAVQRAKDKNGYAGVAAYYDLYDAADQAGDGNGKAKKQEIIDYLQSENESVDEINAWMDIFGWNHISDSGTRSLPMLEEDEEFAQAQLGQPTTNGMPIPELMATRTPVGRQKRITEGGTGVSLRGATGSGMPVDTGGTDTTSFYSRRDEMARPTAQIADELLGRAVSEGLGNQQLYDIIRDPADMRVYIQELGYDDSRFSDDDIKKMQQAVYQYLRYANSNVAI